jgi:putative hemolysin
MDSAIIAAVALALVTIILSGVYSGLETGIYRLSRLRLRLGAEQGLVRYVLLSKAVRDGPAVLLTLLVANNLANYLATSSVTYLFLAGSSERTAELLATLLTAPLLFLFGESLPKNIFLYQSDRLTPYLGPLLFFTHRLLTWSGVVPLLRLISRALAGLIGRPASPSRMITSTQSHYVRTLLRDTQEEGLLSRVQVEMIDRVVDIPGLRLDAVMVPMPRVVAVSLQSDRHSLLNVLSEHAFTRLPVWRETPANIVGHINIYEVLAHAEEFTNLEEFLLPIRSLEADTSVTDAINLMRRDQLKIILVARPRGRRGTPLGIVTMKDLVEELLGELAEW